MPPIGPIVKAAVPLAKRFAKSELGQEMFRQGVQAGGSAIASRLGAKPTPGLPAEARDGGADAPATPKNPRTNGSALWFNLPKVSGTAYQFGVRRVGGDPPPEG